MDEYFNPEGLAAQDYERLLGERVIIFYTDPKGNHRKIVGKILEIDGDRLWLENVNPDTGREWRGVLNCRSNDIDMVSTVDGWSNAYSQNNIN